jgi:hypothetical protein
MKIQNLAAFALLPRPPSYWGCGQPELTSGL